MVEVNCIGKELVKEDFCPNIGRFCDKRRFYSFPYEIISKAYFYANIDRSDLTL